MKYLGSRFLAPPDDSICLNGGTVEPIDDTGSIAAAMIVTAMHLDNSIVEDASIYAFTDRVKDFSYCYESGLNLTSLQPCHKESIPFCYRQGSRFSVAIT